MHMQMQKMQMHVEISIYISRESCSERRKNIYLHKYRKCNSRMLNANSLFMFSLVFYDTSVETNQIPENPEYHLCHA